MKRRKQKGNALLELALGVTLLVFLLIGCFDWGQLFYCAIEVESAARAGAFYGAQSTSNASDLTGMQTVAVSAAPNLAGLTAVASQTCNCPGVSAAASCSGLSCASTPEMYVAVKATYSYQPMLQYPNVAYPIVINRTVTVRAQ